MSGYDPTGFLELAERLVGDARYDRFARSRTAIGRAYYAAFLMVKRRLEQLGSSFTDVHRLHEQVIIEATERNSSVGNKLETLRRYRVDADYEMNTRLSEEVGKRCVIISRSVIHAVNKIG